MQSLVRRLRRLAPIQAANAPTQADRRRQLLVDVSVIKHHDARTGIQRVVRGALLQLLATPIEGYDVRPVFATRAQGYHYAAQDFLRGEIVGSSFRPSPVVVGPGDIFLGLDLAAHLLPRHRKLMKQWKAKGVALHIVVYDLLPLTHPQWFSASMVGHFKRWLAFIAAEADGVLCISGQVRDEFNRWIRSAYPGRSARISVQRIVLGGDLHATAPTCGLPKDSEALLTHLRVSPTVLMVGTIEPRKAYDRALAAFDHLWETQPERQWRLVIVGKQGWKTDALQERLRMHPMAGTLLLCLQDVSDEFLEQLYKSCSTVLVASHVEGFGLPVIEAQRYGKPVLARDLPVFRELERPGMLFFSNDDPLSLSSAIRDCLSMGSQAQSLDEARAQVDWKIATDALLVALGLTQDMGNLPVVVRRKSAHQLDHV